MISVPKRYILAGATFLAVLCASGAYAAHRWSSRHAADLASVQTARTDLQRALAEAAVQKAFADGAEARGDSLSVVAEALKLRAARAASFAELTRAGFDTSAKAAPDTCKEVIQAARSALGAAARQDTLDAARADTAELAAASYLAGERAALVALANVTRPAATLDTASGALASHSRPSFLARIAPKIGAGAAAGVNPAGHFDTVVGITFGWTF